MGTPFHYSHYFPFLLLTTFSLILQAQSYRHQKITTEQGLSHNAINTIYQDKQGFLWFGTKNGLNRYDGHKCKVFQPSSDTTGLSHEDIYSLYEDDSGFLWIGTYAGGLNAYNKATGEFKHYLFDPDNKQSLSSNDVRCIQQGPSGRVWAGTWGGGINVLNRQKNTFKHYKKKNTGLRSNDITCFKKDDKSRIWIGTWGAGLHIYDPKTKQFNSIKARESPIPKNITDIASDPTHPDWFWITSWGDGLFRVHKTKHIYQKIPLNIPSQLFLSVDCDEQGQLWLGTEENGLYRIIFQQTNSTFNTEAHHFDKIEANHINSLYRDEGGTLWTGTVEEGVHAIHPPKAHFPHISRYQENTLNNNKIMAIDEIKPGKLVIGTYGGGVNIWDRNKNTFQYYTTQDGLSSNDVWFLSTDNEGKVWIGSWGGELNRLDPETGAITTFDVTENGNSVNTNNVRHIFQDSRGDIWISAWGRGLNHYDKSTQKFTNYKHKSNDTTTISSNNIWAIEEDHEGRIWIATWGGGLNVYKPKKNTFHHFTYQPSDSNTISDNYIYCLYFNSADTNMWVGTSNGLNKFNLNTYTAKRYYKKDGLPSNIITSIEKGQEGYLWISTSKGLSRLDRSLLKKKINNPELSVFKNYSPSDGLQGFDFNQNASCKGHDGTLYFGGVNGLNYFQSKDVMGNTRIPPIVITTLKKYGKQVETDSSLTHKKHLTLSYQDNFFSIEFAALNYIQPEENQYAYKLEGFDKEWNYTGNLNLASYTNIPGGQYTFKVKGANNDGLWNEEGAQLKITVIPPFWKTNTFYVGCTIFVLLSFYIIYRLRLRSLRRTKIKLERQVQKRTAHIKEQKEQIEEINNDLTNSINYAKRIQEAILPPSDELKQFFPDSFILFYPRDVVSGDFYWTARVNGTVIFTVVDCTGHGVPGAFMSMIGNELLNHTITEAKQLQPKKILHQLDEGVRQALRQRGQTEEMKDGMDLALCTWYPEQQKVIFAGAHNPLYLIREGELKEIEASPYPIGGYLSKKSFSQHEISLQPGDQLYLFSDGYPDQFGGPKGKKFMYKHFKKLLLDIQHKTMAEQKKILSETINDWMNQGQEEQLDDICVMGVQVD